MRTRPLLPVLLAGAILAVTGCSSGGSQVCDTLREDGAGARIFLPYVAWGSGPGEADSRLAVMDAAGEPPADIADDWQTWHDHLSAISEAESAGDAPNDLISDGASGDASEAGSALGDYYVDSCL